MGQNRSVGVFELFVLGGMVALAIAGAMTSVAKAPNLLARPLALLARDLGASPPPDGSNVVSATVDGVPLEVEGRPGSPDVPPWVEVRVPVGRRLPSTTSITAEGVVPSFDLKTGDAQFDKHVRIAGPPQVLLGLLGQEERTMLLGLVNLLGFKVTSFGVQAQVSGLTTNRPKVVRTARQLAALARGLDGRPRQEEEALLDLVDNDPVDDVRRHAAELLMQHHSGSDAATRLPGVLMRDPVRAFRLQGAGFAPPNSPAAAGVWAEALTSTDPRERLQAARGLAASNHEGAAAVLASALPEPDAATAEQIAQGLGRKDHLDAEPALRSLLSHRGVAVRVAAAQGLGHRGDVGSVEALMEAAQAAPIAVRRACKAAIEAIQDRLPAAGRGRLALIDGEDASGRLSQARWGQLQIVDEEP